MDTIMITDSSVILTVCTVHVLIYRKMHQVPVVYIELSLQTAINTIYWYLIPRSGTTCHERTRQELDCVLYCSFVGEVKLHLYFRCK